VTPYKLDVVRLDEITECTIVCPDCQTQVTVRVDQRAPTPRICPSCQKKFDENMDRVLYGLRQAYEYSQHTPFKVEFHLKQSTEKQVQQGK
jgi:hypothetical protein